VSFRTRPRILARLQPSARFRLGETSTSLLEKRTPLKTRREEAWCCGHMAWLPLSAFRLNPMSRSGVESRCRRCRSDASRQWREQNAEHVERYNASRRVGPRERACVDCGARFTAGLRGPASCRCPDCRRERKIEQRRRLRLGREPEAATSQCPPPPLSPLQTARLVARA
jgi:hypothetical protein